jgi:hypothetical protein
MAINTQFLQLLEGRVLSHVDHKVHLDLITTNIQVSEMTDREIPQWVA